MADRRSPDERPYPAKLAAALLGTAGVVALSFLSLTRGPNDLYSYVVGALAVALAVAVVIAVVRRRRRQRRAGR